MSSIYTEQFSLFVEIVETQVMRDRLTDDGSYIQPPPGHGWRVTDYGRERTLSGPAAGRWCASGKGGANDHATPRCLHFRRTALPGVAWPAALATR